MKSVEFLYPPDWLASKNPRVDGLNQQTRGWAREVGLIAPEDTALEEMLEALDPAAFVGWVYPLNQDLDFLRFATDFTFWIVALDDELEKCPFEVGSERRAELLGQFKSMINGGDAPAVSHHAGAFHSIVSRLRGFAGEEHGPRLVARFTSMFRQMLSMVIHEQPKARLSWRDRDYYEAVRPVVSQILWYALFVQIAEGCYLPEPVAEDERIQRLGTLSSLLFGLLNDVISIADDVTGEPVMNAVLMHMAREGCSEAEAALAVARWHNERAGDLAQTAREVEGSFGAADPLVERYVRGVKNATRGTIEWMLRAKRYTPPASCEVRIVSELDRRAKGNV